MTEETKQDEIPREKGMFVKGHSGNPAGRPKGSKNKATLKRLAMEHKLDKILVKEAPKVLRIVVNAAKAGDMQAAKMVLQAVKLGDTEDAGRNQVNINITNLTRPEETSQVVIEGELVGSKTDDEA